MDDGREVIRRIIESSPYLREMFPVYRSPRYRYWETADGTMFGYTTERVEHRFESFVYRPYGKGSRSGKQSVKNWRMTDERSHRLRKDAKARAYRMYTQHRAEREGANG